MKPDLDRQSRRNPWPHEGDTPLQRARRIALAYRQHLKTSNPELCQAVDDMAAGFGEAWVLEQLQTVEADQLLNTAEASELAGVDTETIRQWRKRGYVDRSGVRRRLETRGLNAQGWPMFRAAEILEIAATTRSRRLKRGAA